MYDAKKDTAMKIPLEFQYLSDLHILGVRDREI